MGSVVKVCDALCGSGKTSACINMINNSTYNRLSDTGEKVETHFIFVTEFLSEVDRIVKACRSKNFKSPKIGRDKDEYELTPTSIDTKLESLHSLLANKNNIATTHSMFSLFVQETKDLIREGNYVLILDETVGVVEETKLTRAEVGMLCSVNFKDLYDPDRVLNEIKRKMVSRTLVDKKDEILFFSLQSDTFGCFSEIYILTYMFEYQPLCQFMKMWNTPYELIGVRKHNGNYEFCSIDEMDRRRDLTEKIHIYDDFKDEDIGRRKNDLSYTWYAKRAQDDDLAALSNDAVNMARYKYHAKSDEIMWTVYKQYYEKMARNGFARNFVPFNKRASNDYADKKYLIYLVNVYWRPWEQRYYKANGVHFDSSLSDMYALSSLIQWMFRSAIRNDEEIWIYIPSKRMRLLLKRWILNLYNGKDLMSIDFSTELRKEKAWRERKENYETCLSMMTEVVYPPPPRTIMPMSFYKQKRSRRE